MHIFEITIQRKAGDSWPVVVEQSQSGQLPTRSAGLFQFSPAQQTELIGLELDPKGYGTMLGQSLFKERVRDALMQARTSSQSDLRLLLNVEDPHLKTLHWERLCAPIRLDGQWDFLALDQRALFSRYLPSPTDRRFPPFGRRDLRALLVVANPPTSNRYDLAQFNAKETVSSIQQALGDIPYDVLANVGDTDPLPTLDNLCDQLTRQPYTLLHIVAHGLFSERNGETSLFLLDEEQQVKAVTTTRLLERLDQLQGVKGLPHFAFLSTCESASPKAEAEGALGGLAQRLVRELGMPAVVAMTQKVSIATAQTLARNFYERLREHGEVDRALVEASAELADAGDIIVPALYSRLKARPLFSDDLEDRDLTDAEIEFGLAEMVKLLPERAPILQKEFEKQADILRQLLGTDDTELSPQAQIERMQALTEIKTICEEVFDSSFETVALGKKIPDYNPRCPFMGLAAFKIDDQQFFFGREILVEELGAMLESQGFLAVLGNSGSGKSSVVLAGLIPALQKEQSDFNMTYMTPGENPVAYLDAALQKAGLRQVGTPDEVQEFRTASIILVIDQFEEVFTLCPDENSRQTFFNRLVALAEQLTTKSSARIIITMRFDFWGECTDYPPLANLIQAHQKLIGPMNTAELRSAMEQQALAVNLRFEADLSNTILDAVKDEPGAMPLLQHALLELWQRRHGRWLRAEEYRAIGGVQQALADSADKVYHTLTPAEQAQMQFIFFHLTQPDEETDADTEPRDTSRRVALNALVSTHYALKTTNQLVQRLADARLVVTGFNETTGQEEVEVIHEALIRHWPRLRDWLNENRQWLPLHRQIQSTVSAWDDEDQNESYLYRGRQLDRIRGSIPPEFLTDVEERFLQASEKANAREERRQRQQQIVRYAAFVIGLIIVGVVILIDQPWTRLPVARGDPAINPPLTLNLTATDLPTSTIDSLQTAVDERQGQWVSDAASADMHVVVKAVDSGSEVVNLAITLPEQPAYKLDFLPEIRTLEGDISVNQAPALLRAAVAYSLGDYEGTIEEVGHGHDSPTTPGLILQAQANLFLDNWQESRRIYQVLDVVKRVDDIEGELQMGLALAYWRPRLGLADIRDQAECRLAREQYDKALTLNPEQGDWYIIRDVAWFYCGLYDENYFADFANSDTLATAIEHGADRNLIALLDGLVLKRFPSGDDDDNKIIEAFTNSTHVTIIGYRELGNYLLSGSQDRCPAVKEAFNQYHQKSFSQLDLSNVQFAIRSYC